MSMYLSQFRESLQISALTTWVSSHLEKLLIQALRQGPVPKHLALVMDGNRRFARKHNISTARGHMLGAEVMEKTVEICYMCGVRVVTIYAFSIENFKRPKSQVDSIMELSKLYLCSMSERGGLLDRYGVAMRVLGRLELLDPDVISTIQRRTELTRDYGDKILNVCFSYTSRDEIATAMRQTVADCKIPMELSHEYLALPPEVYKSEIIKPQSANTKIWKQESFCSGPVMAFRGEADKPRSSLVPDSSAKRSFHFFSPPSRCDDLDENSVNVGQPLVILLQNITAETLTDRMLTADNPPLDLLIRTSGVHRLSDFLLWQCHQETQVAFLETLWPDFGLWQFFSVIREWQRGKQNLINENRKKRLSQSFHPVLHRILPTINHHLCTSESIQKDIKGFSRLPEHLSVILSLRKENYALQRLMDEVAELAAWSACARIPTLSVYEKNGILKSYIPTLHQVVTSKISSYYGYPSEQPVVRVFAPHHGIYCPSPTQSTSKKSNYIFMNLLLLSVSDGRETLVDLTKSLAEISQSGKLSLDDINIELIDAKISEITSQPSQSIPALNDIDPSGNDSNGSYANLAEDSPLYSVKPEPDLLFIHGPYIKLDGYPPWQIRLTEIFCMDEKSSSIIGRRKVVKYQVFLRGLCQYAGAQMRFGR